MSGDDLTAGPDPILILTATGRTIDLHRVEADPSVYSAECLALHLSKLCRFNGALPTRDGFYSVAEHSVHCAELARVMGLSVPVQRACLLHDAHEMVVGDIVDPLKRFLGVAGAAVSGGAGSGDAGAGDAGAGDAVASRLALRLLAHAVDGAVARRWDVDFVRHADMVRWIDLAMLAVERQHLLLPHASWDVDATLAALPDGHPVPRCWMPGEAHDRFLAAVRRLFPEGGGAPAPSHASSHASPGAGQVLL